jgi:riboflavin synthase alpha subunit
VGDAVNLEVDVIGKYVARQLALRVGAEVSA